MVDDVLSAICAGLDVASWTGTLWEPSFSSGDPPELAQMYAATSQIIAKDPGNVEARFTRGAVCQGKRWYPQALADLTEVVRLEPRHARAWLLLSEVLTNLGEYDRAKLARQEALTIDPSLK